MEVINNLGMDSKKLIFFLISTVYEYNKGAIVVVTFPRVSATPKNIAINYHWFRQNVGKEILIWKIESENHMADSFTKVLQDDLSVSIRKLMCV